MLFAAFNVLKHSNRRGRRGAQRTNITHAFALFSSATLCDLCG